MLTREEQIRERLREIPLKYRATYRRAVEGKSLRASINAQCLECVGWQSSEVALCKDLGCPLWPVRPYRDSGSGRQGQFCGVEAPNEARGE